MRRGGVVWHTQGSGKSLTMVMLAEALLTQFASMSPRIVLVTDRVDLDDQIYGTFARGVAADQAKTGRHLLGAAHRRADPGRHDADAEVRGGGELRTRARQSRHLRAGGRGPPQPVRPVPCGHAQVLPKACFIGFTGTPVVKSQLPTIKRSAA